MEHLHYPSGVLLPRTSGLLDDRSAWDIVDRSGQAEQRMYGLRDDLARREGLLRVAFWVLPRSPRRPVLLRPDGSLDAATMLAADDLARVIARATQRQSRSLPVTLRQRTTMPDPAAQLRRLLVKAPQLARHVVTRGATRWGGRTVRGDAPQPFDLEGMAEQQPARDSRVRLASGGRDQSGQPLAELDWKIGELDRRSMLRSQELLAPDLGEELDGRVESLLHDAPAPRMGVGYHQMGTTRMAVREEQGVVDPDCRVHGVRNLYVAGSSVFPTGGFANPTLTLVALAARLASHLRAQLLPAAAPSGDDPL